MSVTETPNYVGRHFVLEVGDTGIGHFLSCSGLEAEYETYPYAEGGLNTFVHQLRGRLRYGNLVLTRGITKNKALLEWFQSSKERPERESVTISMLDPTLQVVQQWAFSSAWAVKYSGPKVNTDVDGEGMSIESVEIAHEGLVPGVS
jgi:phage tail-like protein